MSAKPAKKRAPKKLDQEKPVEAKKPAEPKKPVEKKAEIRRLSADEVQAQIDSTFSVGGRAAVKAVLKRDTVASVRFHETKLKAYRSVADARDMYFNDWVEEALDAALHKDLAAIKGTAK